LVVRELRLSRLYETEPWGIREQPPYLNAVAAGFTTLEPAQLLEATREIERRLGRDRSREVHWGPRPIDIDILLQGGRVSTAADPLLPHPRMAERAFVLVPLLELAPDLTDPRTGEPWSRALDGLDRSGIRPLGPGGGLPTPFGPVY
jgi:2-amino-4-hydroxy-6-hydroxymethyldihydropteridine diphosphokinase